MAQQIRLTAAQALVRYLAAQRTMVDGEELPLFAGMWAIFGHGNVAGLGEALHGEPALPTFRGHNEQGMALAAVAFAKASNRRRMMAVTSSIGPGATNMVTAAAVAHVNRLPLLLIPGDVFASRRPDPVLQQVEDFADATVSANDCFRPVSRMFDRISRPEQLLAALPRAMAVLTDPALCGPVTLAFCQDTQAEAYDWPASFFAPRVWHIRRPPPDATELTAAADLLRGAQSPLIIAGGGVHYALAGKAMSDFALRHGIPVAETQAGKSALPADHPLNLGAIGVTGSAPANAAAAQADVILAVGTRLADFTTGSAALLAGKRVIGLNIQAFDAAKYHAQPLVADAAVGFAALTYKLGEHTAPAAWTEQAIGPLAQWYAVVAAATAPTDALPTDAQVIGAVQRAIAEDAIVVAAAGGLPGELHKLWQAAVPGSYHLEYGYSTMGYEIAGALGVKMAHPDREVVALLGDGSWMMMHAELATAAAMELPIIVVLLDNGGFGCINRLQRGTGGASFHTLLPEGGPVFDFVAQARGLGVAACHVANLAALQMAILAARTAPGPSVIVLRSDPAHGTDEGGHWWDVAVPEISARPEVQDARARYETQLASNRGTTP